MEIIKRGQTPEEWFIDVACSDCKSLLRVVISDIRKVELANGPYDFDPCFRYYIKCIVCNNEIKMSPPDNLLKRL